MKRAIMIVGPLVQDHEFLVPYYRFLEAGFEVDVATTKGEDIKTYHGIDVYATISTRNITILHGSAQWDLLFLPGGAKALEKIRQDENAIKFIQGFTLSGKTVTAICHGAQLLISADVIRGRKVSGYYSIADDIRNAGAEYSSAPVVVDGNLVTSPHYKYLGQFMGKVLEVYGDWVNAQAGQG